MSASRCRVVRAKVLTKSVDADEEVRGGATLRMWGLAPRAVLKNASQEWDIPSDDEVGSRKMGRKLGLLQKTYKQSHARRTERDGEPLKKAKKRGKPDALQVAQPRHPLPALHCSTQKVTQNSDCSWFWPLDMIMQRLAGASRCLRDPECARPRKHPGMCKIMPMECCPRNPHCVRPSKHPGMCKVSKEIKIPQAREAAAAAKVARQHKKAAKRVTQDNGGDEEEEAQAVAEGYELEQEQGEGTKDEAEHDERGDYAGDEAKEDEEDEDDEQDEDTDNDDSDEEQYTGRSTRRGQVHTYATRTRRGRSFRRR